MEFSFSIFATLRALFLQHDLLIGVSPFFGLGVVTCLLKLFHRSTSWLYVPDIQPDVAAALNMLHNQTLIGVCRFFDKIIYRCVDRVFTLTEGMKQTLAEKGVHPQKLGLLPLCYDVHWLSSGTKKSGKENFFARKHGLRADYIVLTSGNLGPLHNSLLLLECAMRIPIKNRIFFAIVGTSSKDRIHFITNKMERSGLDNIGLLPLCDESAFPEMLASSDILVVTSRMNHLNLNFPSSLVSYLSSKRPVIAAIHPKSEAAQLLLKEQMGIVVHPNDSRALSEAVLELWRNPSEAIRMAERAYVYAMKHIDSKVLYPKYHGMELERVTAESGFSPGTLGKAIRLTNK